jgi:cyanate permease
VLYGTVGLIALMIWLIAVRELESDEKPVSSIITMKDILGKIMSLRNIWLVAIITSAYFYSAYGLGNWLPTLLESKGMTSAEAGIFASLPSWMGILGNIFLPRLAKMGRRKPILALLILIDGIMIYFVTITSGVILVAALVLLGLCTHSILPILMIVLADIPEIGAEYMGFANGVLFSIGCVFGVFSPLLVGYIADLTTSVIPGIVILSVLTELALIFAFLLKEQYTPKKKEYDPDF